MGNGNSQVDYRRLSGDARGSTELIVGLLQPGEVDLRPGAPGKPLAGQVVVRVSRQPGDEVIVTVSVRDGAGQSAVFEMVRVPESRLVAPASGEEVLGG